MTEAVAIIQARMTSERLPGKTLRPVLGKPLLQYMLERLKRSVHLTQVILATSEESTDDPIETFCKAHDVSCFRGPLNNVALRFKQVARHHKLEFFVRLNGDSPQIDPRIVDQAIAIFEEGTADLVTNTFPRSFPKGQSVEVIRTNAFDRAYDLMTSPRHFEHITSVFYDNPAKFRIQNFSLEGENRSTLNLSVDAEEDLNRFAESVQRLGTRWAASPLTDILELYDGAKRYA